MADELAAAVTRHPTTSRRPTVTPAEYLERVIRPLAADVPAGPWASHRSQFDGALILETVAGAPLAAEPLAHVYAGLAVARYLEALSPAVLLDGRHGRS